jgi:hypothetical protein
MIPNAVMIPLTKMRGPQRLQRICEGLDETGCFSDVRISDAHTDGTYGWNRAYGMKKIVRMMLYSLPFIFKSASRPNSFALPTAGFWL